MDAEQSIRRLFVVLSGILGALAAIASWWLHTWAPLVAVSVVLFCVIGLTLSESAIIAPLLALVMNAGKNKNKAADAKKHQK